MRHSTFLSTGWGIFRPSATAPRTSPKNTTKLSFVILLLVLAGSFTSAKAATFTVETLADTVNGTAGDSFGCDVAGAGPVCTLRGAVLASNLSTAVDDSIVFSPMVTGTIVLNSGPGFGELLLTDSVTITGMNNCARNLAISGNNTSRIFRINPLIVGDDIQVNISGLSLINGNGASNTILGLPVTPGPGGAILNENGATLNLTGMNISGNNTEIIGIVPTNVLLGGGVATLGTDTSPTTTNIARSLIQNNSALGGGGGVGNVGTGLGILGATTNLTNSTVAFNGAGGLVDAAAGGGVLNVAGTMHVVSSTLAYNRAVLLGGGIVNVVSLPLGQVWMRNSLISDNVDLLGSNLLFPDTAGTFLSQGNNFVGNNGLPGVTVGLNANVTIFSGIPAGATVDIVGSVSVGFIESDPLLMGLANNGGCTDTIGLQNASPVLDRAHNCVAQSLCSTFNPMESVLISDQRGSPFLRRVDGNSDAVHTVDIGSYERQAAPTAADAEISGRVIDSDGRPISGAVVHLTDGLGVVRIARSSPFGYFTFDEAEVGQVYVLTAQKKLFAFEPLLLNLTDNLTDVSLVGTPAKVRNR